MQKGWRSMAKELTKQDIFALGISLGYQTGNVAIARDTVDALIEAWKELQRRKLEELRDATR